MRFAPPTILEPKTKMQGYADMTIAPLTVWTQIRSYIKGGLHAAFGCTNPDFPPRAPGTPMGEEEYCCVEPGKAVLGEKSGAPKDRRVREYIYKLFRTYNECMEEQELWDDMDRVNHALRYVITGLGPGDGHRRYQVWKDDKVPFDQLYADECQDSTQGEVSGAEWGRSGGGAGGGGRAHAWHVARGAWRVWRREAGVGGRGTGGGGRGAGDGGREVGGGRREAGGRRRAAGGGRRAAPPEPS